MVNVSAFIDLLEDRGVARTLAEPNLVALSGDTADFLAGGEFPVPVGADDGEAPRWLDELTPRQIDAAAYYVLEQLRPEILGEDQGDAGG